MSMMRLAASREALSSKVLMKRTIEGMTEAGERLIRDAIEANRQYRQAAEEGRPAAEVERLRRLAESLYVAVTDYQLHKHPAASPRLH